MLVFCILFGLAAIANTQVVGDGLWYWYAYLLRSGHHLYSDMHLPLQPLFVVETAAFIALLGKGWIVSKIPAMFHLVAFAVGLLLILRSSIWGDRDKALLFGCCFFVSICSGLYRFDDYHVLADRFTVNCSSLASPSKKLVMATEVHNFPSRKKLLRLPQVIETTGLSRTTLYRNMLEERFPRPIRLGPKSVAWLESDVQDWIGHLSRDGEEAS